VAVSVELARHQWAEGQRAVEQLERARGAGDPEALSAQVAAVTDELRRRLGGPFTLRELADAYERSDRWAHQAIAASATRADWPRTAASVTDAAFHRYARGARDYRP
jgi:hypothetical protein